MRTLTSKSWGVTAKALKVELHPIEVRGPGEFKNASVAWADVQIGGFIMGDHSLLAYNASDDRDLAAKQHCARLALCHCLKTLGS